MTKETLRGFGLTEEQVEQVWKGLEGNFAPKSRFDEVNAQLKQAQATIKERDGQLESLKTASGDTEGMKAQIAELQSLNAEKDKTHAAEIRTLKINAAVDTALTAAKAKIPKAVRAMLELDMDKAELAEDGTVKGLADRIKKLQEAEDTKILFDTESRRGKFKGVAPAETGREDPDTRVDVSKMSYEELAAYMESNPDANI